jgi:hypothetical protein
MDGQSFQNDQLHDCYLLSRQNIFFRIQYFRMLSKARDLSKARNQSIWKGLCFWDFVKESNYVHRAELRLPMWRYFVS